MRIELVREGIVHSRSLVSPLDFRLAVRTSNVFTLPAWMTLACATTNRTIQTSASTLALGLGANAARARSVDGSTWGLALEKAAANFLIHSNPNALATSNCSKVSIAGPSGLAGEAATVTDASSSLGFLFDSNNWSETFSSTVVTCSMWIANAAITAGTGTQGTLATNVAGVTAPAVYPITAWRRITGGNAAATGSPLTNSYNFQAATDAASQGHADVAYFQFEAGKYSTSNIITAGARGVRAADVLSTNASTVAFGGFFDINAIIAPHYASTEQLNDHDLFFIDSNNRVFIQQSTGKIVLRVGGADVISSALTWSRNQAITVRAAHSRKLGRILTVAGATSGNGTATGSRASAVSLGASAYLLGNASGPQESADLFAFNPARAA